MEKVQTIHFEGIEPVIVFGPHDSWLKKIREEFPEVQLTARGNTISLKGEEDELILLEHIFSEMKLLADQHGEILDTDLHALLSIALVSSTTAAGKKPSPDSDTIVMTRDYAVKAKTDGQRRMVSEAGNNDIVFAIGPAGTGKTYTAVAIAVAAWKKKQVKRIVLARPAGYGLERPRSTARLTV